MQKKVPTGKLWIPFWIDKWLFGSTRLELEPDERSVWLDLLALASKNDGHIRANETTPYQDSQLAGLLVISVELLKRTKDKCVNNGKIIVNEDGTLYIINWEKYQLSKRHKRRLKNSISNKSKVNKSIVYNSIVKDDRRVGHGVRKNRQTGIEVANCRKSVVNEFFDYYNNKLKEIGWIKRAHTLSHKRKRLIESRLREGKTCNDLKLCADNFVKDDWEGRSKYVDLNYCIGVIRGIDMCEKWLNYKPEKDEPTFIKYGTPEWEAWKKSKEKK